MYQYIFLYKSTTFKLTCILIILLNYCPCVCCVLWSGVNVDQMWSPLNFIILLAITWSFSGWKRQFQCKVFFFCIKNPCIKFSHLGCVHHARRQEFPGRGGSSTGIINTGALEFLVPNPAIQQFPSTSCKLSESSVLHNWFLKIFKKFYNN